MKRKIFYAESVAAYTPATFSDSVFPDVPPHGSGKRHFEGGGNPPCDPLEQKAWCEIRQVSVFRHTPLTRHCKRG